MADKPENIEPRIIQEVEEYLRIKALPTDESRAQLSGVCKRLEDLYWEKCAYILERAVAPQEIKLRLSDLERLTLDTGLLDARLVDGDASGLAQKILSELKISGEPNHYYLSELIEERLRSFLTDDSLKDEGGGAPTAGVLSGEIECLKIVKGRSYEKLRRFFEDLPGVNKQILTLISEGKLDDQIEEAALLYKVNRTEELRARLLQLHNIRMKVFEKVRARCSTQREVENLDGLRTNIECIMERLFGGKDAWQEVVSDGKAEPQSLKNVSLEERLKFLQTEIKLARSLIQIGALSGGMMNARSVLYSSRRRITKTDTARLMEHVKEVDPRLPGNPNLLIAPYEGNGFFEWDRDSLIIAFLPNRSVEETVVNAVANYRLLVDRMHLKDALKEEYEKTVEKTNFRNAFLKGYRDWALGVGRGKREALTPAQYEFFKKNIGPDVTDVPLPFQYRNLATAETVALIKKLAAGLEKEPDSGGYFHLALLYWSREKTDEAQDAFEQALALNSTNPALCFSMGLFFARNGELMKAENFLTAAITCGANSIWKSYAEDELVPLHNKYRKLV